MADQRNNLSDWTRETPAPGKRVREDKAHKLILEETLPDRWSSSRTARVSFASMVLCILATGVLNSESVVRASRELPAGPLLSYGEAAAMTWHSGMERLDLTTPRTYLAESMQSLRRRPWPDWGPDSSTGEGDDRPATEERARRIARNARLLSCMRTDDFRITWQNQFGAETYSNLATLSRSALDRDPALADFVNSACNNPQRK